MISMDRLLDEGRALEPKPLTQKQIARFYQLHKYAEPEELEHAWQIKKSEHIAYWAKIYKDKQIITYPKLKLAWLRCKNHTKLVYKLIDHEWPIYLICPFTEPENLEARLRELCHYHYCKYELGEADLTNKRGFVVFKSLPELKG